MSHSYVKWLIVWLHMTMVTVVSFCDMTHSYVTWLIGYATCLIHMWLMHTWHGLWCVPWLIRVTLYDNNGCRVILVTWPIQYVTWLIYIDVTHPCDMTHSYVWHDSFICVTCVVWYMWGFFWQISEGSFWHRKCCVLWHMGRLWLVGSLEVYVSFAECRLFHRALLQKKTCMEPIIVEGIA